MSAGPDDRTALRAADFWTALVLIATATFFLWRTSRLPFFKASAAGVDAEWYNSAALVPYAVFGALLALGLALLWIAVRDGGGTRALAAARGLAVAPGRAGVAWAAVAKVGGVALILALYIGALVPRVDFTLSSALAITALTYGFHEGRLRPLALALAAVAAPALYALAVHGPQAEWGAHDDDWATLLTFAALAAALLVETRAHHGRIPPYALAAPVIGLVVPFLLVCAMAFGFRQNVPARTGLVFAPVEYHYYVTLRPWLRGE